MGFYEILKDGRIFIRGNFHFNKVSINGLEIEGEGLFDVIYNKMQNSNKLNPLNATITCHKLQLNGKEILDIEKIDPNISHHLYAEIMDMTKEEVDEYNRTIK